jgi:hypothetical protein
MSMKYEYFLGFYMAIHHFDTKTTTILPVTATDQLCGDNSKTQKHT